MLGRIAKSFGSDAMEAAGSRLGNTVRDTRGRGALKVTSRTGALGAAASGITVPKHTFHGDPPAV